MNTVILKIPDRFCQAISLTLFKATRDSKVDATVCAAMIEDGNIISVNEDGTYEVLEVHDD